MLWSDCKFRLFQLLLFASFIVDDINAIFHFFFFSFLIPFPLNTSAWIIQRYISTLFIHFRSIWSLCCNKWRQTRDENRQTKNKTLCWMKEASWEWNEAKKREKKQIANRELWYCWCVFLFSSLFHLFFCTVCWQILKWV